MTWVRSRQRRRPRNRPRRRRGMMRGWCGNCRRTIITIRPVGIPSRRSMRKVNFDNWGGFYDWAGILIDLPGRKRNTLGCRSNTPIEVGYEKTIQAAAGGDSAGWVGAGVAVGLPGAGPGEAG